MNKIFISLCIILFQIYTPLKAARDKASISNILQEIQILQKELGSLQTQAQQSHPSAQQLFEGIQGLQDELSNLQSQTHDLLDTDNNQNSSMQTFPKDLNALHKVSDKEVKKAHDGPSIQQTAMPQAEISINATQKNFMQMNSNQNTSKPNTSQPNTNKRSSSSSNPAKPFNPPSSSGMNNSSKSFSSSSSMQSSGGAFGSSGGSSGSFGRSNSGFGSSSSTFGSSTSSIPSTSIIPGLPGATTLPGASALPGTNTPLGTTTLPSTSILPVTLGSLPGALPGATMLPITSTIIPTSTTPLATSAIITTAATTIKAGTTPPATITTPPTPPAIASSESGSTTGTPATATTIKAGTTPPATITTPPTPPAITSSESGSTTGAPATATTIKAGTTPPATITTVKTQSMENGKDDFNEDNQSNQEATTLHVVDQENQKDANSDPDTKSHQSFFLGEGMVNIQALLHPVDAFDVKSKKDKKIGLYKRSLNYVQGYSLGTLTIGKRNIQVLEDNASTRTPITAIIQKGISKKPTAYIKNPGYNKMLKKSPVIINVYEYKP